ncbi:DNA transposase THAP9, partial [Araneus ventricosus]
MVVSCCAYGCTERFVKGGHFTFHCFPKDVFRRNLWEKQLRRDNFTSNNSTRICSKHFEAECFEKEQFGKKRLKPDAVPTKFDFPDHLKKNIKPRKRRTGEGECSTTTVVSTSRKKFRYIGDFEEKDMESPTKARKLLVLAKSDQEISRKRIKQLRRRNRSLVKKISTLEEIISKMKKKALISDSAGSVLKLSVPEGSCSQLIKRLQKKGCKEYPPELRAFALTLSFYSNKAYKYVRKVFINALPHPTTLRKWYQSVDGEPGFTSAALSALQMKALDASKKNMRVICALMVDEMSIRKHIEWDGKKFCGYVDLGTDIDDDQLPIATQAYTFLLNSVNGSWKIPIGYFLIDGLDANERANLIRKSLEVIHETGIDVISLTFDGTSVNLSTANCLGCTLNSQSLNTSFKHPITNQDVCVLLDPSHMIKLIRNTLASKGSLFDGNGKMIKWDYIVSLHKLQHTEGLLVATKLRTRHIEWKREKMKVKLATQVLSASVADALLYLANDLKLPEFEGCEATAEFLKCFNTLFDILNSRNILSKGFKAPLQKLNIEK